MAHAVIPHHHHHSEVCFVKTHCQNDINSHKHDFTEHNHEHNGNHNDQSCVLKQVVAVPQKSFNSSYNRFGDQHHLYLPQVVLFNSNIVLEPVMGVSSIDKNDISFYYSLFVATGLGLRAPPEV